MQSLAPATNSAVAEDLEVARAMLDAMPAVMWFIRRDFRRQRARGLSVPQFRALAQLNAFEKVSLSGVAENLGCSLPTASRMVGKMVVKGLVKKCVCHEDRRQMWLMITSRGRALFDASRRSTQAVVAEKIAHLDPQHKQQIQHAMETLHAIFHPENDEPAKSRVKSRASAAARRHASSSHGHHHRPDAMVGAA
jgi:DNA-binding MarR family transcriptional regulator